MSARGKPSKRLAVCSMLLPFAAAACGVEVDAAQQSVQGRAEALEQVPLPAELADKTDYTLFETGQVRPIALSKSGQFLYAVNTPDDRLEVFRVQGSGLTHLRSVSVGMRPVAVAELEPNLVWVVNHLSDSVSVVDTERGIVLRTLLVGDEPRDIVFAGPGARRAFITTAHRGQNSPIDPQLTTEGVGRADVWVFDADRLGSSMGGDPLTIVTLFSDTPRALAVSPDQSRVYVAAFNSGNQTTTLDARVLPGLNETNVHGQPQPNTGIIAKYEDGLWVDAAGRNVTQFVNFSLPDYDVFTIDAMAEVPAQSTEQSDTFAHVGTTLFNMAVNPKSGAVYVTNTEANNFTRFEGPGLDPERNTTVRGKLALSRISVLRGGAVTPVHLNKHIDYDQCCEPVGNDEAKKSLAFPRDMAVTADGETLFVTAFGSSKIGVFKTAELESDSFVPSESSHIALSGGGPSGIALDERNGRLYALTGFNNAISVVDLASRFEIASLPMHSPEPDSVALGRPFLHDAFRSSSHGDSACASCHVDGDMDHLAWDLGDPTVFGTPMPGTSQGLLDALAPEGSTAFAFSVPLCSIAPPGLTCLTESQLLFNAHKGPMTTQTLAGMDNHGSMHWRGDRTAGEPENPGAQPNEGMFDERAAFNAFNVAFPGLLGRHAEIPDGLMNRFTDFILQNTLPPNPIRSLDNSLTAQQERGREIYFGGPTGTRNTDIVRTCNGCHALDPVANAEHGVERPGFFGTDGRFSFENEAQLMKVPHLRNVYQKVGMFGPSGDVRRPFAQSPRAPFQRIRHMGDQIRGFGFLHDGGVDTVFSFFQAGVFTNLGPLQPILAPNVTPNDGGFLPYVPPGTYPSDPRLLPPNLQFLALLNDPFFQQVNPETGQPIGYEEIRAVEAFVMAFPSNLAPIVGQQVTLTRHSGGDAEARLVLLEQRAAVTSPVPECDLVAKANVGGREIGYLYDAVQSRYYGSDGSALALTALRNAARSTGVTFTCVPPGDGARVALDRDLDGVFDAIELGAGSDPADPASAPL